MAARARDWANGGGGGAEAGGGRTGTSSARAGCDGGRGGERYAERDRIGGSHSGMGRRQGGGSGSERDRIGGSRSGPGKQQGRSWGRRDGHSESSGRGATAGAGENATPSATTLAARTRGWADGRGGSCTERDRVGGSPSDRGSGWKLRTAERALQVSRRDATAGTCTTCALASAALGALLPARWAENWLR
ncbi:hypothetical protein PUNSTDRAFT_138530 [Punctularia strigosozonata HHB-11173 SS5]|uniref:Uncharacterized protein n=1 Tax=Punctularia strigosozonata (strain HHB-11173) TaxID=741275 RepID=R7S258_PUNST|nr:uncharacterized protein PUNSTDRAFT_138530 [Punctularia strigosozonata HHB-11173 SS5]EIN04490.1 hypothetical protein PUNSTDRAFT_138530 [Punctularia strigosozonata HHB-11173 SS5]